MQENIFYAMEITGTMAFAVSGAVVGLRKGMDILGVAILGLTTATGGGIIRDLILGATPPAAFLDPVYAILALLTSLIAFWPLMQRLTAKLPKTYNAFLLITDSVGLGIFTVIGVKAAYTAVENPGILLLIFVGAVTGVGGGILRDVLAGEMPSVFVKNFYATASIVGALLCCLLWEKCGSINAMLAGIIIVMLQRILAALLHWELPKSRYIL